MERGDKYGGEGGGGSGGEMLERRVAKLETDVSEMKASLKMIELAVAEIKHLPKMADFLALQKDFGGLKADVARIDGRVSTLPTWWMLLIAILATWGAGAGIVYALT